MVSATVYLQPDSWAALEYEGHLTICPAKRQGDWAVTCLPPTPNVCRSLTKGHVQQVAEGGVMAQAPLPEAIPASPGHPEQVSALAHLASRGGGSSGSVCCEGNDNS